METKVVLLGCNKISNKISNFGLSKLISIFNNFGMENESKTIATMAGPKRIGGLLRENLYRIRFVSYRLFGRKNGMKTKNKMREKIKWLQME